MRLGSARVITEPAIKCSLSQSFTYVQTSKLDAMTYVSCRTLPLACSQRVRLDVSLLISDRPIPDSNQTNERHPQVFAYLGFIFGFFNHGNDFT